MLYALRQSAEDAVRRVILGVAGGVLLAIGAGFLTAAAWQGLTLWNGPIIASLIIGAIYLGLGLICLALTGKRRPVPPAVESNAAMLRVVDAFFGGIEAGARARRGRRY